MAMVDPWLLKAREQQRKGSGFEPEPYGPLLKQGPMTERSKVDAVTASQTATTGGRKFDGGKPQYGLLPPYALEENVKVLTYGAQKYEPDNWKRVPDGPRRYFDAAQRHLWAFKRGEKVDPETGLHHLAHAICCLEFILDIELEEEAYIKAAEGQIQEAINHINNIAKVVDGIEDIQKGPNVFQELRPWVAGQSVLDTEELFGASSGAGPAYVNQDRNTLPEGRLEVDAGKARSLPLRDGGGGWPRRKDGQT